MKTRVCLLLVLIGVVQLPSTASVTKPSSRGLFAADLLKQISKPKTNENVVFSPISIQIALAMLYLGAEGQTASELENGMRLPSSNKITVAESFAQIFNENKGEAQLDIANKIFVKSEYKLSPTFNELAKKYYQSEAEAVNFNDSPKAVKIVNDWVKQKTNNKISNILQPGSVNSDTDALIVNAIYFKGKWSSPFSKLMTRQRPFWVSKTQSIEVDTMSDNIALKYGDFPDLDATAIEMPYKNSDLSMLLILPKELDGLARLEEKLSSIVVNDLPSRMRKENIDVLVPKFKIEFSVPLVEVLKKLGVQSIFEYTANLSGLLESGHNVRVSDVQHKAFIDVDEAGAEAAAATIINVSRSSLNLNRKRFAADHPFVFAIISPDTVYFVGHVAKF